MSIFNGCRNNLGFFTVWVGSSHLNASFGSFCVQIGQLFEVQWWSKVDSCFCKFLYVVVKIRLNRKYISDKIWLIKRPNHYIKVAYFIEHEKSWFLLLDLHNLLRCPLFRLDRNTEVFLKIQMYVCVLCTSLDSTYKFDCHHQLFIMLRAFLYLFG